MTTAADMYEQRYRQCREQGRTGWFSGDTLADVLSRLAHRMEAEHLPRAGRVLEMGLRGGRPVLIIGRHGL